MQLTKENVPEFEALSYARGSTGYPIEILIETKSGPGVVKITQNLHDALHRLRYETRPRVLWIDAICIDQQNIPERSSQVRRIADIYPVAEIVIVWLGRETNHSSLGLNLLELLGTQIEVDWGSAKMRSTSEDTSQLHWANFEVPLPYNERELAAIVGIFSTTLV